MSLGAGLPSERCGGAGPDLRAGVAGRMFGQGPADFARGMAGQSTGRSRADAGIRVLNVVLHDVRPGSAEFGLLPQVKEQCDFLISGGGIETVEDARRFIGAGADAVAIGSAAMKDADLIGVPLRVVIGPKGLKQAKLEVKWRWDTEPEWIALEGAAERLAGWIREEREDGQRFLARSHLAPRDDVLSHPAR